MPKIESFITFNTAEKITLPENWKLEPGLEQGGKKTYSADLVINAFLNGMDKGVFAERERNKASKEEAEKIKLEKFYFNIKTAMTLAEEFIKWMNEREIPCENIFLKVKQITEYNALYCVDKKSFLDDSFLEVYKHSREIKNKNHSNTFILDFSFMPLTDHLNEDRLAAEGYSLRYEQKKIT